MLFYEKNILHLCTLPFLRSFIVVFDKWKKPIVFNECVVLSNY
jgi:hypothetical protein